MNDPAEDVHIRRVLDQKIVKALRGSVYCGTERCIIEVCYNYRSHRKVLVSATISKALDEYLSNEALREMPIDHFLKQWLGVANLDKRCLKCGENKEERINVLCCEEKWEDDDLRVFVQSQLRCQSCGAEWWLRHA